MIPAAPPAPTGVSALVQLRHPTPALLQRLSQAAAATELSYEEVGATLEGDLPSGFRASGTEQLLGSGDALWTAACDAIDSWAMFTMPWIVMPSNPPAFEGQNVVFASRQLGFWSLHSCRVVAVLREPDRHGFAYGTLATHAVQGEEFFSVERRGDDVYFCIRKFARPGHPLVRLMQPVSIWIQGCFDRDATAALRAYIGRKS